MTNNLWLYTCQGAFYKGVARQEALSHAKSQGQLPLYRSIFEPQCTLCTMNHQKKRQLLRHIHENSQESRQDISRTRVKSRTRMTHQKTNSECQMPRGGKNDARIAVTQRTGLWETVFELLEEFAKHSNKENPHKRCHWWKN